MIDAYGLDISTLESLLKEIAYFGDLNVKRIYGDFTNTKGTKWKNLLQQNSIKTVHQYENITEDSIHSSLLVIDAMDLLYSQKIDCFCLVSNEKDFTNLATRIKEEGLKVIGYGGMQTPIQYKKTCDTFYHIKKHHDKHPHELTGLKKEKNIYEIQDEIINMVGLGFHL